jgi:hypothetical protein
MLLAPLVGLLTLIAAVQGPGQVGKRPPTPTDDPAYAEVVDAYWTDRQVYDQARVDAARGRVPPPTQHPAAKYWSRMESVAARGSRRARQWLCENLADGLADPAQRVVVLRRELDALLACCADDTALFGAITGVKSVSGELGLEPSVQVLDRIAEQSTNSEVRARALLEEATLVSDRGRTTDPDRLARAATLRRSVVLAFPSTKAGAEAAESLYFTLQKDLTRAMEAWVDAALRAQRAGEPVTAWGEHPFHTFRAQFESLSATRYPYAVSWIENLYPSFVQAEKLAPGPGLDSQVRDLGAYYAPRDLDWARIRMKMLALGVRVGGGDAPWIRGAAATTAKEVHDLAPLSPLPFTQAVLELATVSESRAQALWIEAQTRIEERSEGELLRALQALDAIVKEHPDMSGLAEKAAAQAAALRCAMPGAVLPDSRTTLYAIRDAEDQELVLSGYRGRVVLIDVFDSQNTSFAEVLPERIALHERLADRPFAIVGLCTSRLTLPQARERFAELGITWRSGLLQGTTHPYLGTLFAEALPPTMILVDAQGVIRARGRPFAEMARLAEELTGN